jgi:hypothetical protein
MTTIHTAAPPTLSVRQNPAVRAAHVRALGSARLGGHDRAARQPGLDWAEAERVIRWAAGTLVTAALHEGTSAG